MLNIYANISKVISKRIEIEYIIYKQLAGKTEKQTKKLNFFRLRKKKKTKKIGTDTEQLVRYQKQIQINITTINANVLAR